MKHHYVVAFTQGSSGRFISNVLWRMINNLNEEVLFTEVNSAHVESPWEKSWEYSTNYGDPNIPDVYVGLKFHNDIGLLATHTFPNYEEFKTNLLNIKLIIISINEPDLREIAYNVATKNKQDIRYWSDVRGWLYQIHLQKIDEPSYNYHNTTIPVELSNRILLINYNEIYKPIGESFVALEKLKAFTNTDIGSVVFESYKKYVYNRNIKWNQ